MHGFWNPQSRITHTPPARTRQSGKMVSNRSDAMHNRQTSDHLDKRNKPVNPFLVKFLAQHWQRESQTQASPEKPLEEVV